MFTVDRIVVYGLLGLGVLSRDKVGHFTVQNTQRGKNYGNSSFTIGGMEDKYKYIKWMSQCLNLVPHNAYKSIHTSMLGTIKGPICVSALNPCTTFTPSEHHFYLSCRVIKDLFICQWGPMPCEVGWLGVSLMAHTHTPINLA